MHHFAIGIMYTILPVYLILLFSSVHYPLPEKDDATIMIEAAQHFLSLVAPSDLDRIAFPFEADERTHWNFVPIKGQRKGLALKNITPGQRTALHRLLQAALSTEGYLKVTSIQQLERLLGELENRLDYRNPGDYYLTIFGTPSSKGAWGWRFEGHHLSLNISIIDGKVSTTPTFMGANPGRVKESVFAGLEILSTEITLARQLMASLDEHQKEKAIIAEEAPREIITGNAREAVLDEFEGLSFTEMNESQQDGLILLISAYVGTMEANVAALQLKRIQNAGFENIYFSWAGSLADEQPHYYRIHGPNILIEYDNTQNNANHVHSVWRDLENDFGRDFLKEHYERDH